MSGWIKLVFIYNRLNKYLEYTSMCVTPIYDPVKLYKKTVALFKVIA